MIRVAFSTVFALLTLALVIPTPASAIDFMDGFEHGSLDAWRCDPCEDWSVTCDNADGTALVIQPFAPSLHSILCVDDLEWVDFRLDVDLRGLIPTDKMVRFRVDEDTGEFYYVNLRSAPVNDMWLSRYVPVDGSSTVLATVPLTHDVGQWHHLSIQAEGGRFRVWFGSVMRIDATDSDPIAQGGICLGGWTGAASRCAVQWDDVEVIDLTLPVAVDAASWGRVKSEYRD